ncbi:ABC transporter ATP-binding protein [Gottschalkiaceae bacterium SANA]|nr:ABC transporter ATP-binding protein [Gottschalkiaceae bacterium SANA]
MDAAIRVENLIKSYGQNTVIKEISFEVKKGESFALLGANGAGKTTTLECIEGLRRYESGKIFLDGSIGVQLQSSSLQANMKAIEAFTLFSKWNREKVDLELFSKLGLKTLKNKQYGQMSTGQKRRLHLALALIGSPDIIFLDEPTAGLDVEGRVVLHEHINWLKARGKTIMLASHDMAEVESLCDRIAILKDGKIAFSGGPKELTSVMGTQCQIYVKTRDPLQNHQIDQGYFVFQSSNIADTLYEVLENCRKTQNTVLDVKIERATLEQRFMDIAREEK